MIFIFKNKLHLIADKDIRCDARDLIFDRARNNSFNKVTETKTTVAMFDSRKANIVKGTPYYQFNFIDSQSGEEYEFNCHKQTHDTCVRLNLYPDILQKFFKT